MCLGECPLATLIWILESDSLNDDDDYDDDNE